MIKCLIVDDEPVARLGLEDYLSRIDSAEVLQSQSTADNLEAFINETKPDLIFLDVEMPGMSGIDFLKVTAYLPLVIIVTAFPEYAVQGYELDLVDYLVKPVSFERFLKAYQKAAKMLLERSAVRTSTQDHLFVRDGNRFEKINFGEIIYLESMLNYVKIHTTSKFYITYSSLKGIEEILPSGQFLKIHKSYIISLSKITALQGNLVYLNSVELPISRALKQEVYQLILSAKKLK